MSSALVVCSTGGYYINIVAVDDPNAKLNFFEVLAKYPYLRRGVARILYMSKKVIEALCKLYDSYYTNWVPYMVSIWTKIINFI